MAHHNPTPTSATSVAALALLLGGCATWQTAEDPQQQVQPRVEQQDPADGERQLADRRRIAELERQLVERQRKCAEDKHRLESAYKESQARLEATQNKLNKLLAIERDLRNSKGN